MQYRLFLFTVLLFTLVGCQNTASPTEGSKSAIGTDNASLVAPQLTAAGKVVPAVVDSQTKVVYFTMDDGPLEPSYKLTQIVNEKKVKISEFAVGKHALASKKLMGYLNEMRQNPYMEVCNHSYSHAYGRYQSFYSNAAGAANDIMGNQTKIALDLKIVRMPGRDIWATPQIKRGWKQTGGKTAAILLENGYKVYGWDIEWEHYGNTLPKVTPEVFVEQVDSLFERGAMVVPNHLVILGHDEMLAKPQGEADLRRIIDLLLGKGYVFEFISNYPK